MSKESANDWKQRRAVQNRGKQNRLKSYLSQEESGWVGLRIFFSLAPPLCSLSASCLSTSKTDLVPWVPLFPPLSKKKTLSLFSLLYLCLPQQATTGSTIAPLSKYGPSDHQHGRPSWLAASTSLSHVSGRGPPICLGCCQLLVMRMHLPML